MKFFSSTGKAVSTDQSQYGQNDQLEYKDNQMRFDFSLINYTKESFNCLIINPACKFIYKALTVISVTLFGTFIGIFSAFFIAIFCTQHSSIEHEKLNSFIRNFINSSCTKNFVDFDSAAIRLQANSNFATIAVTNMKIDDFCLPKVLITPNIFQTIAKRKLVVEKLEIQDASVSLHLENGKKSLINNGQIQLTSSINFLSSIGIIAEIASRIILSNLKVKIHEDGNIWNLYDVSASLPGKNSLENFLSGVVNFKVRINGQKSPIEANIEYKINKDRTKIANINFSSINPFLVAEKLSASSYQAPAFIVNILKMYNLPLSGTIGILFNQDHTISGTFDLSSGSGSIKIPGGENKLSIQLGKRIENIKANGNFTEKNIFIQAVNFAHKDATTTITGITIPCTDIQKTGCNAIIDGAITVHKIKLGDLLPFLPSEISCEKFTSIAKTSPQLKLEMFKADIRGSIDENSINPYRDLSVDNAVFKIKDTDICLGNDQVFNVCAIGRVLNDGFEVKISKGKIRNISINDGSIFISNDMSWIGQINVDVSQINLCDYLKTISKNFDKFAAINTSSNFKATANLKVSKIIGENYDSSLFPFKILVGQSHINAEDNSCNISASWDDKLLKAVANINDKDNNLHIDFSENLQQHEGSVNINGTCTSKFMSTFFPIKLDKLDGILKINSSGTWENNSENHDINIDLKNNSLEIPLIAYSKKKKENGTLKFHIFNNREKVDISKISLLTGNVNISGECTLDHNNSDLLSCSFDGTLDKKANAKINFDMKDNKNAQASIIGQHIDVPSLFNILKTIDPNISVTTYLNIDNAKINAIHSLNKTKGNLTFKAGKIIGGSCYSTLGGSVTIAIEGKDIPNTDNYLLSMSISDAGKFLKHLGLCNSVLGGNIRIFTKSSKDSTSSLSGIFEMNDFIVKDSMLVATLFSLSSPTAVQNIENFNAGFNFLTCNLSIAENRIVIEDGKTVGPGAGISFSGFYDRMEDNLQICGIMVPMSSLYNSINNRNILATNYRISGSQTSPSVEVEPIKQFDSHIINNIFAGTMPISIPSGDHLFEHSSTESDPFKTMAFDKKKPVIRQPKTTTNEKFGIQVTRGNS